MIVLLYCKLGKADNPIIPLGTLVNASPLNLGLRQKIHEEVETLKKKSESKHCDQMGPNIQRWV